MSAWAVAGAALGLALCTTSLLTLAYAAVLTVFFDVKAAREERWLSAAFPGYAAYQARVGKLIPCAPLMSMIAFDQYCQRAASRHEALAERSPWNTPRHTPACQRGPALSLPRV